MGVKSVRRLDGQGRVILPSHIRKALNLTKDSEVTINMTKDGAVMIRPSEERCCICGKNVEGVRHATMGDKKICMSCASEIVDVLGSGGEV